MRQHGVTQYPQPPARVRQLAREIAERHGITPAALVQCGNGEIFVAARRDLARALRAMGYSYPMIGAWIHRHHTTVMSLCRPRPKIAAGVTVDSEIDFTAWDEWAI